MTKQLFYACPVEQPFHPLNEEESRHVCRTLRLKEGDELFLTDGKGHLHGCRIDHAHPAGCRLRIISTETIPASGLKLHIAMAPTKNINRFEWFLEKATEIGISEITLLICAHSERTVVKTDRLRKILISAMKQSLKCWLPVLHEPITFSDLIHLVSKTESLVDFPQQKFIAWCESGDAELLQKIYQPGSSALILIGPEGDFSPEEVEQAIHAGFIPVSLGKSRLRTETAGIVACCTVVMRNL